MKMKGRVWKFQDHVDTDLIIPARFLNVSEDSVLAEKCFADLRPEFAKGVQTGDVLVAGVNFGCGSSREHAPRAIKAAGISVIIAESFARIFYRNSFNIGLPILESKEAAEALKEGGMVSVDLESGEILDLDTGEKYLAMPVPEFMRRIVQAGGLLEHVRSQGRVETGSTKT